MTTLYIIGNGFDLYHGLDTRYQSFAIFLKRNYSSIYYFLTQYFGLPDLDPNEDGWYRDPLWADFENALADLDFQTVLDDNSDYLANPASPDFRDRDWHTFQIEMEGIVNNITTDLYSAFKDFIVAVEFPDSVDYKLLELEPDSIYLNFNYTDTIEKYYFISTNKILYIHGKAKQKDQNLILGHGRHPSTFEDKEVAPPEGLDEEELEMWREQMSDNYDYSFYSGKSELMTYYNESFKSTESIIQTNEAFFDNMKEVGKVVVLGHSISEVDQPYFKRVIESLPEKNILWVVSYYSDAEKSSHLEKLMALGLYNEQIQLVKMEDLRRKVPTLF